MKKSSKEIPDKLFFRISEVARIADVEPYVLRFWESEFKMLAPEKNQGGWRVYRRKDVERILEIKRLLYDEGFTIEGARKHLNHSAGDAIEEGTAEPATSVASLPLFPAQGGEALLREVKSELESILTMLNKR